MQFKHKNDFKPKQYFKTVPVKDDCYFHVRQCFLRDMAYKPINI